MLSRAALLVAAILTHTPWWVFALLVVITGLGVQALQPRTVTVRRLLVVPVLFIAWGLLSLAERAVIAPMLLIFWFATAGLGMAFAWQVSRLTGMRVDPANHSVTVPGSVVPLVRNLAIFLAKYGLGVAFTLASALRGQVALADIGVSGLSAGFFAGWLLRFAFKYRTARASAMLPAGSGADTAG